MNKHVIKALYKKEMMDILRDKKTMLMMIIIPLVLYPLIFLASMWFASSISKESVTRTYKVGLYNVDDANEIVSYFTKKSIDYDYKMLFIELNDDNIKDAIKAETVNAYITKEIVEGKGKYVINYMSSNNMSATASTMIQNMFKEYNNYLREEKLRSLGYNPDEILSQIAVASKDQATAEESVGSLFGYIIPFLLITSVLMGAMYPAIDTTAGEKERGTLETLLTLPVKNIELIVSKFLATSTIAVGAAFLNVISMAILGAYFYETIAATNSMAAGFSVSSYIPAILCTLAITVIFAMFASAVCLVVCIFAKSFKEAQNYTTPVMLVFMFAGMAGMLPTAGINAKTSLIPVVNVSLLINDLFSFKFNVGNIITVIGVDLAYTVLAVLFMTKVFSSENVLFGDSSSGIKLIEKRSDMKERQMPGIGDVLLVMAIAVLILFFVSSLAVVKFGIYGLMLEQALFLLLVVIYSYYIKADFKKLFSLKIPKLKSIFGTVFSFAGTYLLVTVLTAFLIKLFPKLNHADGVMSIGGDESLLLAIIAMALFPAVCEEALFRGFLFGTLKDKYKVGTAILVSGFLFGVYHLDLLKIITITVLGSVMAYCVYKGGSILLSILMHFINNLLAVLASYKPEVLKKILPFLMREKSSDGEIAIIVLAAIIMLSVGIVLLKTKDIKNKA